MSLDKCIGETGNYWHSITFYDGSPVWAVIKDLANLNTWKFRQVEEDLKKQLPQESALYHGATLVKHILKGGFSISFQGGHIVVKKDVEVDWSRAETRLLQPGDPIVVQHPLSNSPFSVTTDEGHELTIQVRSIYSGNNPSTLIRLTGLPGNQSVDFTLVDYQPNLDSWDFFLDGSQLWILVQPNNEKVRIFTYTLNSNSRSAKKVLSYALTDPSDYGFKLHGCDIVGKTQNGAIVHYSYRSSTPVVNRRPAHKGKISSLQTLKNGLVITTGQDDRQLIVWRLNDPNPLFKFPLDTATPREVLDLGDEQILVFQKEGATIFNTKTEALNKLPNVGLNSIEKAKLVAPGKLLLGSGTTYALVEAPILEARLISPKIEVPQPVVPVNSYPSSSVNYPLPAYNPIPSQSSGNTKEQYDLLPALRLLDSETAVANLHVPAVNIAPVTIPKNTEDDSFETHNKIALIDQRLAELENEQINLQRIQATDRVNIQEQIEAIHYRLQVMEAEQKILLKEREIQIAHQNMLKRFRESPNLEAFYTSFQIAMEQIFISAKAASGPHVEATPSKLPEKLDSAFSIVGFVFKKAMKLGGEIGKAIAEVTPGVNVAVKLAKKGAKVVGEKRQLNIAQYVSELATLTEILSASQKAAVILTLCFERQLKELPEKVEPTLLDKAKQKLLKENPHTPAQLFAIQMVGWIYQSLLQDKSRFIAPLENSFVECVLTIRDESIGKGMPLKTVKGVDWYMAEIVTRVGIETSAGVRYSSTVTNVQTYGYCRSEAPIAEKRLLQAEKQRVTVAPHERRQLHDLGAQVHGGEQRAELLQRQLEQANANSARMAQELEAIKKHLGL